MLRSASNPKILYLLQLRKSAVERQRNQSLLVSGEKFIREALKVASLKMLLSTAPLPKDLEEASSCFFQTEPHLLSKITGLALKGGMVAEFEMPKASSFSKLKRLLVLDRISDPGNLGAIIRSQIAFGWEQLFLLPGCCDLFNDKVVRSSAATLFHLEWQEGDWQQLQMIVEKHQLTPLVADMKGKKIGEMRIKNPCLLLSNEARGVSKEAEMWGEKVTIPISTKVESLNAAIAASLLLYELR